MPGLLLSGKPMMLRQSMSINTALICSVPGSPAFSNVSATWMSSPMLVRNVARARRWLIIRRKFPLVR